MKTTIACEVFYYSFSESIYFRRPLNFECLLLEVYSKYNVQAFY